MYKKNDQLILSATDLVNYLGCKHLTELDREVVQKKRKKPDWSSASTVVLRQLGLAHEAAYLRHLNDQGFNVKELDKSTAEEAIAAMKEGSDIIAQARLTLGNWTGYADILRRVEGSSKLGDYHYEVDDTKLAQITKAGTILQLCLYAQMLTEIQGVEPKVMKVIKPGEPFDIEPFQFTDFKAYFTFIKSRFEATIAAGNQATYPEPVEKCSYCKWWKTCDSQWREDDHLSLVAGLQRTHRNELEGQEIATLEQYANEPEPFSLQTPKR